MRAALVLALLLPAPAFEAVEVSPLTDGWLRVLVDEGRVVHAPPDRKRADARVEIDPLDPAPLARPDAWSLRSPDDPAYREPKAPLRVGRKSRGADFAPYVDGWKDGRAVNDQRPDHVKEHAFYLQLPSPLRRGLSYEVAAGRIRGVLKFDESTSRSEALHVNQVGFPADAPVKFGYVFHWMGDAGSLEVRPLAGRAFRLLQQPGGATAFEGKVAFRTPKEQAETGQVADAPPHGNYLKADVAECAFGGFSKPGRYVLSVDGVGCSFPFEIGTDVYRGAFRDAARALYHNRSGIELKKPFTDFERPAPHHPKLTPGFAGKLVYTRSRFVDWSNGDAAPADKPAIEQGIAGPVDVWGWYQDAGDWDGYLSHLTVPSALLLAWDLAPGNFRDGELGIPESGNGIPDVLDEAAWLPRFCRRLRAELQKKGYGTGGVGLRVCGDHFGGDGDSVPSWKDVNRTWIVSGEDPWSTYRYAGVAAWLARCLEKLGKADPEGADWAKEAVESFRWAQSNTKPGDEAGRPGDGTPLKVWRAFAAAALFRLTGEADYGRKLAEDLGGVGADVWGEERWACWLALLPGGKGAVDGALLAKLRGAVLRTCESAAIEVPSKRAVRWGGNWWLPMLVGQQTTPWTLEGMVGHALTKDADPAKAAAFRAGVLTSCDYALGANSLNLCWMTGSGSRSPRHVFHLDAWLNGKDRLHPGLIPYGPWKKEKGWGAGPWDKEWAFQTLHPPIDEWPANERWFENRYAPLAAEFTIHQQSCMAAAAFGWLCAPGN
jgi:hypothetical protein